MQRLVLDSLGPDAPFRLEEAPSAPLGPNEVRIAVRAAGINPIDTKIRGGAYGDIANTPVVLGCDVAGEITDVGAAVPGFAPGNHVYGCAGGLIGRDGSYASEMRADHRLLARMPANLSFREAAALPLVTITAWEALIERAKVQPGERVLVHGAAGGVGLAGVEIAHALGARVIARAGVAKHATLRARGAEALLDSSLPFRDAVVEITGGQGVSCVLDTLGGPVFDDSLRALGDGGTLVTIGYAGGGIPTVAANILLLKNISVAGLNWGTYVGWSPGDNRQGHATRVRALWDQLVAWWADGKLRPEVGGRYPLCQFRAAMEDVAARRSVGRVVLLPQEF